MTRWASVVVVCVLGGSLRTAASDQRADAPALERDQRLVALQERFESGELSEEDAQAALLALANEHGVDLSEGSAMDIDAPSLSRPSLRDQMVEHLLTIPRKDVDGALREIDVTSQDAD